jgi:Ca2+-binding EF-hand superfamily protein
MQALRPKLNDEQKQQLEECFELMDADGSGAIDADELGAAFKVEYSLIHTSTCSFRWNCSCFLWL